MGILLAASDGYDGGFETVGLALALSNGSFRPAGTLRTIEPDELLRSQLDVHVIGDGITTVVVVGCHNGFQVEKVLVGGRIG